MAKVAKIAEGQRPLAGALSSGHGSACRQGCGLRPGKVTAHKSESAAFWNTRFPSFRAEVSMEMTMNGKKC